jgi:transcriptional regulator with PAS, ATPase and Fis domain
VRVLRRQLREHRDVRQHGRQQRRLRKIYQIVEYAAPTNASVLISGESGTGKELVAQTLHAEPARGLPHAPINCAAIPDTLLESEPSATREGVHRRDRAAPGVLELADHGTLFLDDRRDDAGDTSQAAARPAGALSSRRVGGKNEQGVDIRIVAATNPGSADGRPGQQAPRRSLLSSERLRDQAAAASRPEG